MRRVWALGALLIILPALPAHLFELVVGASATTSEQSADVGEVALNYLGDAFNPWRILSAVIVFAIALWVGHRWGGGVTRPAFWGFLVVLIIYPTPMHIAALASGGGNAGTVLEWIFVLKVFDIMTLALPIVLVLFALIVIASARARVVA